MPDKPISTSAGRYSRAIRAGLIILILIPAVYFRSAGLFRGLADQFQFHPDESKQVMSLFNYLQGRHVHYFDSLFYDGYPYGLNRQSLSIQKILIE